MKSILYICIDLPMVNNLKLYYFERKSILLVYAVQQRQRERERRGERRRERARERERVGERGRDKRAIVLTNLE